MDFTRWGSAPSDAPRRYGSSLPHKNHRFAHCFVVDAPSFDAGISSPRVAWLPQQPDATLSVMAGHRDEFIEYPTSVLIGKALVAVGIDASNCRLAILLMPPAP